jgi:hypothetical protein
VRRVLEGAVSTPRHFDPSSIACRLLVERIAGSFENNVGGPCQSFSERRKLAARKYRNRMESATHEIAAQLAGYAKRRHFSNVCFIDAEHAFCENFPWFRLRQLIEGKLNAHGIRCENVAHTVTEEALTADENQ